MKKFNWITTLLLNIVTCGIYSFYMWYKMSKQQNEMAEAVGEKKIMGFFPAFLLGCVTCSIFLIVWYYQYAAQSCKLAEAKGAALVPSNNAIVMFLMTWVPIYGFYALCNSHNNLVDAYEA